jgi:hypothetical protein
MGHPSKIQKASMHIYEWNCSITVYYQIDPAILHRPYDLGLRKFHTNIILITYKSAIIK